MKIRSRGYLNFALTVVLISTLIVIAYYMSNKQTIFSRIFDFNSNKKLTDNLIINQRYNLSLEGSVLDNIYNVKARVIEIQEHRTLQKQLKLSPNMYLPANYLNSELAVYKSEVSNDKTKFKSMYMVSSSKMNDYLIIRPDKREKILLNNSEIKNSVNIPEAGRSNRFEGLIEEFRGSNKTDARTKRNQSTLISSIRNWDSSRNQSIAKIARNKFAKELNVSNIFADTIRNSSIDKNIIRYSEDKKRFDVGVVKDFSKDPLKSVIENVLIPGGLPNTPANVNAIAKGMGLPSGALGSRDALANSLGLTKEELADPNTKLPSSIVLSINRNKGYLGRELNVKNTTLAEFYTQALEKNFSSGIILNQN